jgi:hypothetical protein
LAAGEPLCESRHTAALAETRTNNAAAALAAQRGLPIFDIRDGEPLGPAGGSSRPSRILSSS